MKRFLKAFIMTVLFGTTAFAQAPRPPESQPFRLQAKAALRARSMGDSIVLRWALTAQDPWPFVMETGFDLERVEMDAQNKVLTDNWVRLNTEPIKPISPQAFKALITQFPEDDELKTAAGMLYGTLEQPIEAASPVALIKARADEAQNRYGFGLLAADFSARAATAMGLRYADHTIQAGHRYVYRLIVRPTGGGYPQDTALVFAVAGPYEPLAPPVSIQTKANDRSVTVTWANNAVNPFSAYWIERSKDGVNFTTLNKRPFLQMSFSKEEVATRPTFQYRDSVPRNYEPYYYRVRGVTGFAEISVASEAVAGMGVDQTFAFGVTIEEIKGLPQGPRVVWNGGARPKDLKGFQVLASAAVDGLYEPLSGDLGPTENAFQAPKFPEGRYYKVVAFDTAGNESASLPLYYFEYDTIPPPVPVGLTGYMDTTGMVHLQWPMPRDGDTRAFRLYYHNAADHEPNPLLQAPITDTLYEYQGAADVLTKNLFIRIAAVDANGNHSAISAPFRIRRPDRIPPTDAVISDYRVTDSAVTIYWQRSNSGDVASQTVLRRPYADVSGNWQTVARLGAGVETYVDRTVKPGEDWYYAVLTTDSSNLSSPVSFPLRARVYAVNPPAGIGPLKAVPAKEKGLVELSWSGTLSPKSNLLIARSVNESGFVPVARLDEASIRWTDGQTIGKGKYQYRVRQILEDGTETVWVVSNELVVE